MLIRTKLKLFATGAVILVVLACLLMVWGYQVMQAQQQDVLAGVLILALLLLMSLFIMLVMDITEQKQAAATIDRQIEVLRKTEHRLAEAQRVAHIGNWEFDLLTNELWWSEEVYRIFEIDQDKFSGTYKEFLDLTHPQDRGEVNRAYSESVHDQSPYEIEHHLLMADGRIKYVHQRCETHYDESGTALRSIGTYRISRSVT